MYKASAIGGALATAACCLLLLIGPQSKTAPSAAPVSAAPVRLPTPVIVKLPKTYAILTFLVDGGRKVIDSNGRVIPGLSAVPRCVPVTSRQVVAVAAR
jgi:hypothetical protein